MEQENHFRSVAVIELTGIWACRPPWLVRDLGQDYLASTIFSVVASFHAGIITISITSTIFSVVAPFHAGMKGIVRYERGISRAL